MGMGLVIGLDIGTTIEQHKKDKRINQEKKD